MKSIFLLSFFNFVCIFLISAQNNPSEVIPDSAFEAFYPYYDNDLEFFLAENNYDFIEDQISCVENIIPLNYNERVHAFVNYFAVKNRDFINKIIERKNLYFPTFEKYLAKYNMPDELKYLAVIESGLNSSAYSSATAVGLWQFMPYTGRSYQLYQDSFIDERMDFELATEAACKHLKQLYNMFGDWELAIAAYNTGPGNVRKAMRRSGKKTFWEIYPKLYRETRAYLPQYVAVTYIMNYLEDYHFNDDNQDTKYMPEFDTIMVKNYTHLPSLAAQIGLCEDDLTILNPALKWKVMPNSSSLYPIRIPKQALDTLLSNRIAILAAASEIDEEKVKTLAMGAVGTTYGKDKVVYNVKSGDVLGSIASRYSVRLSDLKRWNNLSGDIIRVGQRLDIWLKPGSFQPQNTVAKSTSASSSKLITETDSDGIKTYVVQPGDTLWDISKMFNNMSIEKIKKLNGLSSDNIKPGQKLKVG